jgi:hypothetical protein
MDAVEQGTVLAAFSRALGREAHVLTEDPDLLFQQMYHLPRWENSLLRKHLILSEDVTARTNELITQSSQPRNAIAPKVNIPFI